MNDVLTVLQNNHQSSFKKCHLFVLLLADYAVVLLMAGRPVIFAHSQSDDTKFFLDITKRC